MVTKRILIAYDGSECADAALYSLIRAGLPAVANALVVSVTESWFRPPPPSSYEAVEPMFSDAVVDTNTESIGQRHTQLIRQAEDLAGKAAKWIQASFPRWDVQIEPLYGSPASELLVKSDEWEPDLIVMGSHGRSAITQLVLGSISHKVVTEALCSVRIGRYKNNPDSAVRVLIGMDGSNDAAEAARAAASRDWPDGTEIRLVVVYDAVTPTMAGAVVPKVVHWVDEENRATVELARKVVESCETQFQSHKLLTSHLIKPGDPKRALIEEADKWGADCVFVGSRGLSRIDRFLLGSVSAAVAARARCSVEIVRSRKRPSESTDNADNTE